MDFRSESDADADADEDYDRRLESPRSGLETVLGEGGDLFEHLPKALALRLSERRPWLLGEVDPPRRAEIYLLEQVD